MADRKISQLPERVTSVLGIDLLTLVGNTAGTPTNLRVQVKNFLSNLAIDMPQTTLSAFKLSANVTANATTATLAAAEVALVANSSINVTIQDRIGLVVRNEILNGNSTVTGLMAAGVFKLDTGNSAVNASTTFGVVIDHTIANTSWARLVKPRAFIAFKERAGVSGNTTTYLLDIGAQGNTVSADTANVNTTTMISKANVTTATHKVKVSINGTDYWLFASTAV